MAIVKVGTANFQKEVLKSAEPVVVIFSLEGCPPCKTIAPFLEEIATELAGKVKIVKLNDNENPELAAQYGVGAFPTLAMLKDGKFADIFLGEAPKMVLRSWISKIIQTTWMNTSSDEHPTPIEKVDTSNFPEEVLKSTKLVILTFWAEWFSPSELLEPILEQIATELAGRVKVVKLNADENPELAAQYDVSSFPTLAIFKGGEVAEIYIRGSLRSWISKAM
ncbi:thiol reductase thioredoxin [Sinorhizobium meliloti]|nr:thiol reductase thioredoxin [Sinorhizobium meliloti]MDE3854379.1 thiol reductase thioredoxin [Sinorhizobium meliloti]MQW52286.1 thiol reductase thioredoxin [Sinorhizobium meliloti]